MSLEANKLLVQRFIEEVMNKGNTEAISEFCVAGSMFAGGLEHQVKAMKTAFPDNQFTIERIVAEDDQVSIKATVHGTNTGMIFGLPVIGRLETPLPPTGKAIMTTSMSFATIRDGKITSFASELDVLNLLLQLGWTLTPPGQS